MGSKHRFQEIVRLLMTVLVFTGAAIPSFAACQMLQPARPAVHTAMPDCCAGKDSQKQAPAKQKQSSSACCCLSNDTNAAQTSAIFEFAPHASLVAILPSDLIVPEAVALCESARIPTVADNSPPESPGQCHFGRAPPVA